MVQSLENDVELKCLQCIITYVTELEMNFV